MIQPGCVLLNIIVCPGSKGRLIALRLHVKKIFTATAQEWVGVERHALCLLFDRIPE